MFSPNLLKNVEAILVILINLIVLDSVILNFKIGFNSVIVSVDFTIISLVNELDLDY